MPPGAWEVLINAAGSATVSVAASAPGEAVPVLLPAPAQVRVEVPELKDSAVAASLTILGPDGRPVRGLQWGGEPISQWRVTGGEASVETVPPGPISARVQTSDGRSWNGNGVAQAGGVLVLTLE